MAARTKSLRKRLSTISVEKKRYLSSCVRLDVNSARFTGGI
ncbi:hypothetical protein BSS2_II0133 [Brucella suis bv. 1 str. S2]|uniref:Uncharacterized protein n=1 Tax=Brucella suis biovar 1 (strain 1330) TaxID=204722 RepID=A0A0H3G6B6_BRUSU|nr:hypothetical protein BRA0138 [Brucella suis 1330]AEM19625.1 hypothetical protein BS1330_II0137 [Brucella suis 1330]AEU07295.1 hypothetical protein BSVBI22_B0137 [Brucella suis VBI22]AHN47896.1 hypothetical protein BSS2_II0133 [Brucella suis bv. 1 str. S2]CDL77690.1 unnamed protein product [Brucella canis str. Oliveri]